MCGIAGIVSVDASFEERSARSRVESMLRRLAHRGPDGSGIESSRRAVLGARRLSIRGLDGGAQPIVDPESGIVVVCNGEIDNHRELRAWLTSRGRSVRSASDVGVIPALCAELGPAFVERLEGAFALAVHDPRSGVLTLARDRAGERPLFYTIRSGTIVFASEVGALASDPGTDLSLDVPALQRYLRAGSFVAPQSPFAAVRRLAPATIMEFDARGAHERRYWRWNPIEAEKRAPDRDAFDAVLRAAVRRQCDVEVPFGLFVSGGLDSSLIAAIAREEWPAKTLPAYTLRFDETSYDEGWFAERIAQKLRLERIDVRVRAEDVPLVLARLVRTAGEPLADPAWVPSALLAARAAQDVKVALVGEGADEILGGYPTYVGTWLADAHGRLPTPVRRILASLVHALPQSEKKVTIPFLLERFVESAHLPPLERHREWTAAIRSREIERLGGAPVEGLADVDGRGSVLDRIQIADFEHSLAEGLLTKSDRAAMMSGLELRAPFLDARVLEFAAHLRPRDRVHGFTTKAFLKRYARGHLPRAFVVRRKRGLSVPLGAWLRGPLHDWARGRLAAGEFESAGLKTERVLAWFDEHAERRRDHARGLSALLALAEWRAWVRGLEAERRARSDAEREPIVVLVPHAPARARISKSDCASETELEVAHPQATRSPIT